MFENDFLIAQLKRLNLNIHHEYYKIVSLKDGKDLADKLQRNKAK